MTQEDKIRKLFEQRDKAVRKKNKELFLSTQLEELPNSGTSGYLAQERLQTNVTAISFDDDKNPLIATCMVHEKYYSKTRLTHSGFLMYFLVNTVAGWKIYKIVW